jgi:hypothetical protein
MRWFHLLLSRFHAEMEEDITHERLAERPSEPVRMKQSDPGQTEAGLFQGYFTPAPDREFGEKRRDDLTGDVGESVAVKAKERSATMTLPEEFYEFAEGDDLLLFFFPLAAACCLSL